MVEVKLSSKNQIVIPREVREALGLKSGDRLLWVVRDDTAILLPKLEQHSKAVIGIGKGLFPPDYLEKERESWRRAGFGSPNFRTEPLIV